MRRSTGQGTGQPFRKPDAASTLFSSRRERRLWTWTFVVVAAIYATLGFARSLAARLVDEGLIVAAFWAGLILVIGALVAVGLKARPRGAEIGVALGVAGAYLLVFLRMTALEERSHLIEYSVVALLMFEALKERAGNGRRVPAPAFLAIAGTVAVGVLDECIQRFLPNRVFDPMDMAFNVLAAFMAVAGVAALRWARRLSARAGGDGDQAIG